MGERVSRSRASSSGEATSRQRGTKGSSTTAAACGSTSRSRAALGRDNPARASWDTARTGGPNPSAATHGAARVARINDSPVLRHTSTSTPRPVNTPRSRPPTAAATVEVPTPPPTPATHGARIIGTPRRLGAAAEDADGAVWSAHREPGSTAVLVHRNGRSRASCPQLALSFFPRGTCRGTLPGPVLHDVSDGVSNGDHNRRTPLSSRWVGGGAVSPAVVGDDRRRDLEDAAVDRGEQCATTSRNAV